jgi:hypothetical protein
MKLQLTFIPIQIWVRARNTKHENTWSEYYKQQIITDILSFIAAISMVALWHQGKYQLGYPVTAMVHRTVMTEMHRTILVKLVIQ